MTISIIDESTKIESLINSLGGFLSENGYRLRVSDSGYIHFISEHNSKWYKRLMDKDLTHFVYIYSDLIFIEVYKEYKNELIELLQEFLEFNPKFKDILIKMDVCRHENR
jgi:uncharacterized pyridoxamine 5'-phosphate oxidase family protein